MTVKQTIITDFTMPDDFLIGSNEANIASTTEANLDNNSYYRSSLFAVNNSINPLISCATPLLALNNRLRQTQDYHELNKLYQRLTHEIKAFVSHAEHYDYRLETILIARYILCAVLDETIAQSLWGKVIGWHDQQLLNTFQKADNSDEKFFQILERLSRDPRHHIHLLELMYISLRSGHKGKYRLPNYEKEELDHIIDELYQTIRMHSLDQKPALLGSNSELVKSSFNQLLSSPLVIWKVAVAAVIMIIIVSITTNIIFDLRTQNIQSLLHYINISLQT